MWGVFPGPHGPPGFVRPPPLPPRQKKQPFQGSWGGGGGRFQHKKTRFFPAKGVASPWPFALNLCFPPGSRGPNLKIAQPNPAEFWMGVRPGGLPWNQKTLVALGPHITAVVEHPGRAAGANGPGLCAGKAPHRFPGAQSQVLLLMTLSSAIPACFKAASRYRGSCSSIGLDLHQRDHQARSPRFPCFCNEGSNSRPMALSPFRPSAGGVQPVTDRQSCRFWPPYRSPVPAKGWLKSVWSRSAKTSCRHGEAVVTISAAAWSLAGPVGEASAVIPPAGVVLGRDGRPASVLGGP